MKVAVSRTELVNLIAKLQNIIASKPAIPILANVLLEAYDGLLTISATDLTVSMKAYIEARVSEPGAITLPAKRFFQLMRELTSHSIEIHSTSGEIAFIHADSSRFRLNGMHKSEFPALPDFSSSDFFTMECSLFKSMLSKTAFAAARDDSRHVLNGVLMRMKESQATFIGTDGKRLAKVYSHIDTKSARPGDFLLPLKAVEEMIRVCDVDEPIKMSLQNDKVALEVGSICLMTKLLSGQYPDVDRVVPESCSINLSLHREELMTLLRQVSLFTSERSNSVHFVFGQGELHLMANSSEIGEGKVVMPVDYSGEKLEIAFNPSYFLDILRHSEDEVVTFGITDSYNPGLITDSSTAIFVIMPMRLNHS